MTVLRAQRRLDYLTRDPAPTMGQVERLGSGGLRIPAAFTRIGVFHYWDAAEARWIGELRPPDEVFATASLATLRGVPLTHLHPSEPVTRDSWSLVARGHVEDVRVDGLHVRGHVVAAHSDLCRRIEAGEIAELSCGYSADCEIASGVWEGTPYERIQRNIRYDHVACGPKDWARGGPSIRLALDGGALPLLTPSIGGQRGRLESHYRADAGAGAHSMTLKFLRPERAAEVGGKMFDLTKPDEAKAAAEAARAANRRTDAIAPEAAVAALDTVRGQLDMAIQTIVELASALVSSDVAMEQATSPEQLDAMSEERADCISRARVLAPEVETRGKTLEQIQRAALLARGIKTDGESADYVRGAFSNATKDVSVTFTRADVAAMGDRPPAQAQGAPAGANALTGAWQTAGRQTGRA